MNGIRNIRSQDYSFPGTFVPMMELSGVGKMRNCGMRKVKCGTDRAECI